MSPEIHAVLFDLDGTLADTLADLADATNAALQGVRCPIHPVAAYRHFVGDGARALCQRVLPAGRDDLLEETLRRMREHYDAHCFDRTKLYPGITELVAELRRRGLKLAVLSNKPDHFTRRMIAHYFADGSFDVVRGQLPEVPLKPDPAAARQIARELGVPPPEWLYLGDTNTDMRTAGAAGMQAVGVLWGFRDRAELLESGAQQLVAAPAEVLRLL